MEHLVNGLSLISKQQTHIWSQIWEKAYPLEWAPTYSYPLFALRPQPPDSRRGTPPRFITQNAALPIHNSLFSADWSAAFNLRDSKLLGSCLSLLPAIAAIVAKLNRCLFGCLFILFQEGTKYLVLSSPIIEVVAKKATTRLKLIEILHRKILDSMSVISQQLASLPSHRRC